MNKRIQELAEQVGAVRNVLAMGRHDGVLFTEFELEKFAELIARECIDVVSRCNLVNVDPIEHIKVHFGISDFEQMVEKGTKAWADIPDDWVDELRGGAEKP
jgi:hypothetical protein